MLKIYGQIQIRYWQDEDGTYQSAYKLADAQKKNYLELTTREIVDLKELQKLGYEHTTYDEQKEQIKWLPLVATYQYNEAIRRKKITPKAKELEKKDYNEDSDSENLRNDPMPPRGGNKGFFSQYTTLTKNFFGTPIRRREQLQKIYEKDPNKYSALEIGKLIQKGDYREADRRLTLLMEAGDKPIVNFSVQNPYLGLVIKRIEHAYNNYKGEKPSEEVLRSFHRYDWYTKLKILTGVKLPELIKENHKSHFDWK